MQPNGDEPQETDLEPWQAMAPTVEAAGRALMKQFGRWVELEDVTQTIWLHYFQHAKELDRLTGTHLLWARLKSAGSRFCQQEMAYRIGIDYPAQYHYSRGEVRGLLEFALAGGLQGEEPQATICGWVDLQRAMDELGADGRQILADAYGPHERAAMSTTQRSVVSRTLTRLQQAMNTPLRLLQAA